MDSDLSAPLIPAEVDLRAYPFTPIFRARLFGSSFHAQASDAEWRAGVTLWLKSWDQVPAGTLPDDDIALCRLAELGRDLKSWAKIKERALHGWVKCSDGLLHHQVVAEGVLEAWSKSAKASTKGKAGAAKRWGTGNASAKTKDGAGNGTGIARAMPSDSNREGREKEKKDSPPPSVPPQGAVIELDLELPPNLDRRPLSKRGTRLAPDWKPDVDDIAFAVGLALDWERIAANFLDYWIGVPGAKGVKMDWHATWRNRCRWEAENGRSGQSVATLSIDERIAKLG